MNKCKLLKLSKERLTGIIFAYMIEKDNLIKYLEDFVSKTNKEVNIKGNYLYLAWSNAYKDLLERVKNNNYES